MAIEYWQLEENTDRWELEENTDDWLLEESGSSGPNIPPQDMLVNPVRRKQQAGYVMPLANLLLTTLAVTATLVPRDPLYAQRPQVKAAQQYVHQNLLPLGQAAPAQDPFRPVVFEQVRKSVVPQQVEYLNQTISIPVAPDYYFLNDLTSDAQVRKAQAPFIGANLLLNTLAQAPVAAPFIPYVVEQVRGKAMPQDIQQQNLLNTTLAQVQGTPFTPIAYPNPIRARVVIQPDQQNGTIQLLTFVAPAMPYNNFDWPNPQPLKPIPDLWNTSQGQNPDFIPPFIPPADDFNDYIVRHRHRRSRR